MKDKATKFDYFVFDLFEALTCKQTLFLIILFTFGPAVTLAYLGNLLIDSPGAILGWTVGFCVFPVYFVRAVLKNMGLLQSLFKKKEKQPLSAR